MYKEVNGVRVRQRPAVIYQSDGRVLERNDLILDETPLAIVINGKSYAVMMITPMNIEDFVFGFLFTEGLIKGCAEVLAIEVVQTDEGSAAYVQLPDGVALAASTSARMVVGGSGCGLCGIPCFEGLLRLGPAAQSAGPISAVCIEKSLKNMHELQRFNQSTGTAHAAILVTPDRYIVREDIGRHNAVDKVAGSLVRQGACLDGLVLLGVSSRLTFEIVQKALRLGVSVIAAISGVSGMAIRVADAYGVTLIGYAREGRMSIYTHRERVSS